MTLTGHQIRAGRALAGMSQAELAAAAGVVVGLLVRIEATDGMAMAKKADLAAIRGALEDAGVEFVPQDGGKVMLRSDEPPHGEEDR